MNSSDIAKLAGVSRSTVSRILNGYDDISYETRKKVEAIIKEYNYIPNSYGRGLAGKANRIIGLFTHSPETARAGALALRIISCGFIVSTVSVMTSGTFEGLGKGLPSLIISLIRYIAIIPIAFVLSLLFGAVGVWHAFWVTELIAAGVSIILFFYSFPLKQ